MTQTDFEMFARFGVASDLLEAAGVCRLTDAEARRDFGITPSGDMSGIVFPYVDPITGRRATCRLRRDRPEIGPDGKPQRKYVCPFGDNPHLYYPPGAGPLLADVSADVIIVEAEKSALAIAALAEARRRKILVIATGGCWGWRGKCGIESGANGEREEVRGPLPDFDRISWVRRKVIIVFDANVASNCRVRAARQALAVMLTARGARVFFANLPQEGE